LPLQRGNPFTYTNQYMYYVYRVVDTPPLLANVHSIMTGISFVFTPVLGRSGTAMCSKPLTYQVYVHSGSPGRLVLGSGRRHACAAEYLKDLGISKRSRGRRRRKRSLENRCFAAK
jgi:hypothetical protein